MSINTFFDKVYVITCHSFCDRQNYIRSHFDQHNIAFEFHTAIEPRFLAEDIKLSQTEKSLVLANMNCVLNAKLNKFQRILICEDDISFCDNFTSKFNDFIINVPQNWNFLHLGNTNRDWTQQYIHREYISNNLYKFKWGTGSHCIALQNMAYDLVINTLMYSTEPLDFMYYSIYSKYDAYCPEQFFADALSGYKLFDSTITHKYTT